jgi:RNA polymerase sigma factor (sigma-70 family)
MQSVGTIGPLLFSELYLPSRIFCNESHDAIDYICGRGSPKLGASMTDWSQIVEQHAALVWRTARRLLDHEADAADCFQRTFISALELSQRIAVRHWPALLRRLATARALEQLRGRLRDRERFAEITGRGGIQCHVDDKAVDPAAVAQGSELAEQLRRALVEIEPRQAEVFCLASIEEFSYAEIGEQLGITANHVGVILNRAKEALRERLKAHDPATVRAARQVTPTKIV